MDVKSLGELRSSNLGTITLKLVYIGLGLIIGLYFALIYVVYQIQHSVPTYQDGSAYTTPVQQYNAACLDYAATGCNLAR